MPSGSVTFTRAAGVFLELVVDDFFYRLEMVLQNGLVPGVPELSLVINHEFSKQWLNGPQKIDDFEVVFGSRKLRLCELLPLHVSNNSISAR